MTTQTKPSRGGRFMLTVTLIVVALIFAAMVGFNQFGAYMKAKAAKNMPESSSLVTVMEVNGREWTPVIEAVGSVRPNQGSMLSSQNAGTVVRVNVKAGDRVKRGQLLVELDSKAELESLKVYEAQLPAAKAAYERNRKLYATQSVSKADFESAESTYNQLVANIASTKSTIARRQVYAPFDGVAGIVNVNVGQYVSAGTEMVRVEDSNSMKVSFTLAQTEIERVAVGQKVTATVDAFTGETFEAQILAIDPAVNTSTGLINLEAVLTGDNVEKLYSGMFARLRIALPTEYNQVVVPQVAVTYTMYGETAYVLNPLSDEDKAKLEAQGKDVSKFARAVQVTTSTKDRRGIYAQLNKGMKVGDTIITSGFQRLRNNALVEIADQQPVGLSQPASTPNM